MAGLQWRVEIEWACQERRSDKPEVTLMSCIRKLKALSTGLVFWLSATDADVAKVGEHVLMTVDEMTDAEILFKTGLMPKEPVSR